MEHNQQILSSFNLERITCNIVTVVYLPCAPGTVTNTILVSNGGRRWREETDFGLLGIILQTDDFMHVPQ